MSASIGFRPCEARDIDAVLDLWLRAEAVPRPTDHVAALSRRLERDPELFVLALDGGRIVGSLMGGWDGWRGNLYRLAVDPGYRRQGLALALLERVEDALRAKGAARIVACAFPEEPGVLEFWAGAGYSLDADQACYSKDLG